MILKLYKIDKCWNHELLQHGSDHDSWLLLVSWHSVTLHDVTEGNHGNGVFSFVWDGLELVHGDAGVGLDTNTLLVSSLKPGSGNLEMITIVYQNGSIIFKLELDIL